MSTISVNERDVVIPGELLASGIDFVPGDNTYRQNENIYAKIIGLVSISGRVIRITPLSGPYLPKIGDKIIARVIDITMSGWRVSTGTAYSAMLNVKDATTRFVKKEEDLSQILGIGDYIIVTLVNVTSQNMIDVSMKEPGLQKIVGGRIIQINSQKVPRVIGKKGSMVSMIKEKTQCDVVVGQNGFVWIKGTTPESERIAEKAIQMIEERSHTEGLTERMDQFLSTPLRG